MIVTTGYFDGVHIGHRLIIKSLVETAHLRGEESAVVTFHPHPRAVLQQEAISFRLLSSRAEKKELLLSLGVDHVEEVPFSREFASLTAEQYIDRVLLDRFGATAIVIGYDNRIGSDGLSRERLAALLESRGIAVVRPERAMIEDEVVSSSRIRRALEEGDCALATRMLGRPYNMLGAVVGGQQLGRTIGFPTANMKPYEPLKLMPAPGVYFVGVRLGEDKYYGMCNIGTRPTVSRGSEFVVETHIFDFTDDIYGLDIELFFYCKIRSERRFESIDILRGQLQKDKMRCLELKKSLDI